MAATRGQNSTRRLRERNFALPTLLSLTLRRLHFSGSHPSGPTLRASTPLGLHPSGLSLFLGLGLHPSGSHPPGTDQSGTGRPGLTRTGLTGTGPHPDHPDHPAAGGWPSRLRRHELHLRRLHCLGADRRTRFTAPPLS